MAPVGFGLQFWLAKHRVKSRQQKQETARGVRYFRFRQHAECFLARITSDYLDIGFRRFSLIRGKWWTRLRVASARQAPPRVTCASTGFRRETRGAGRVRQFWWLNLPLFTFI